MPDFSQPKYQLEDSVKIPLRLLNQMRTPSILTELNAKVGPYAVISQAELNVIVDLLLVVANALEKPPMRGTVRIYGQYYDRDPEQILAAHFKYGAFGWRENNLDSDAMADANMQLAQEIMTGKADPSLLSPRYCTINQFPTGDDMYLSMRHGGYRFLVLSTTYGRFYIHVLPHEPYSGDDSGFLTWAIAQTLACLRPQDTGLKRAITTMREKLPAPLTVVMDVVQDFFQTCELPSLKAWRNDTNISSVIDGRIPLYFEQVFRN